MVKKHILLRICLLINFSSLSETYQGPTPIFGIAVGAIIPFTSCWMILQKRTHSYDTDVMREKLNCVAMRWVFKLAQAQEGSGSQTILLTPLVWELPRVSLLVVLNHDDFSVAWHHIVAVMPFLFPACFQHPGCPLFPVQPRNQSGRQRHPGQTGHSRKGM